MKYGPWTETTGGHRLRPLLGLDNATIAWEHRCDSCGQRFTTKRFDAQTCSQACRKRLWRAR